MSYVPHLRRGLF